MNTLFKLWNQLLDGLAAVVCAFLGHTLETREGGDYCTRCRRLVTRVPK